MSPHLWMGNTQSRSTVILPASILAFGARPVWCSAAKPEILANFLLLCPGVSNCLHYRPVVTQSVLARCYAACIVNFRGITVLPPFLIVFHFVHCCCLLQCYHCSMCLVSAANFVKMLTGYSIITLWTASFTRVDGSR